MSSYTMSPGIVCDDGTILGRVSDVDLFGSFELLMDKTILSPEIDGLDGKYQLYDDDKQVLIRRGRGGGKLWKTSKKTRKQVEQDLEASNRRNKKLRLEVLREANKLGLLLPIGGDNDE